MHQDHKIFIQAIKSRKKVVIQHRDNRGRNTHTIVCRPLFYIPANSQDGCSNYYFWDGNKGEKGKIFWVTPKQIVRIGPTQEPFDPAGFALVSDEDMHSGKS